MPGQTYFVIVDTGHVQVLQPLAGTFSAGGGFDTNAISVLGQTSFGGHILPLGDNAFDIGSTIMRWRNGNFAGTVSTGILFMVSAGGGFTDFPQVPAPMSPPANTRRMFNNPTTGKLSVKRNDGVIVSLEEQGGAGTTKESHIDLVSPGEPQTIS